MRARILQQAIFIFVALLFAAGIPARAQTPTTGIVRGQVTDPSGATVAGAAVLLTGPPMEIARFLHE